MSLTAYRKKRTLATTPEPKGGEAAGEQLRFVVQKHHASRLHYDFRLEFRGVLKSWAVPKGPSLNPQDKRLAVAVEDHPYDYKDFEGTIPKGNYGAGTVIVWDEGTYEPLEAGQGKKAMERELAKQWKAGSIKLFLHGRKLKGEFALVRMKGQEDNAWLLIKHDDQYASKADVTLQTKSVVSGKTLGQIAEADKPAADRKSKSAAKPKAKGKKAVADSLQKQVGPQGSEPPIPDRDIDTILQAARPGRRPKAVSPMLATLVDEPFDDPQWEYEVKWDGYRAIAIMDGGHTALQSRNDKSFADKFAPVFDAIKAWGVRAVVDGEIVAVADNGISSFNKLQNWRSTDDGQLVYYVFDRLWYEGKDMTRLPLSQRKAVLHGLVPPGGMIRAGYSVEAEGTAFFDAAQKLGLEGILAKRSDSPYKQGDRSKDWLKIKLQRRQEVVIGGYTRNEGTSKLFSSLLLGVYEGEELLYVGKVGTGFKDREQRGMMQLFKPLIRKTSPYAGVPDYDKRSRFKQGTANAEVVWLRPTLVCEIRYTEVTPDGVFRHPAFIALREDKDAKTIVAEAKTPVGQIVGTTTGKDGGKGKTIATAEGGRHGLLDSASKTQVRKANGKELKLTNLDKVYWPGEGYTKGDMLNYYMQMARYILPYLKNRPQSLNRFPDGINGKNFYQKDMTGTVPDWVEKHPYRAKGERKLKHYMLCNNEATLLYMANLGTVEMNPWSSTVSAPDNPTWCVLDLDPDKGNTFGQVIEVAQAIHQLLEDTHVPSYCKTSGSTGLHIYIPFGAKYTYDQAQLFARWVATQVDAMFGFTSVERMISRRKGKVYIDFLQNRPAATLAAPYSLRPKPGATVSMPLYWEEVKKGLEMADFTIRNALDRAKSEGDIFKQVSGRGINLKKMLKHLEEG